ncbi:MAG: phosphatase PAP2 family protein [Rickettsiales bacterium]|jgi:membrane-associated phospholipid phosphatase|nr:phosphatase PAP2 family protein [Rickettsiales bacterium]
MFLNKNNTMNWKKLAVAAAVSLAAVVIGFFGGDVFIQPWFRGFDWAVWRWFDILGEWKIIAGAALVVFIIARVFKLKSQIQKLSANVFCSIILAEFAVGIIKVCVGRMRPVMFDALGQTGFNPFSFSDTWHSFPSGHAAAAFAALVSIGLVYPKIKPLTWTIAVSAGISRVCIGAHFPSDVIFAAFAGMAAADLIVYFRQNLFTKR